MINLNEEEIIRKYTVEFKALTNIAKDFNVNKNQIKNILKKYNIEIRNSKKMPKSSLYKNMMSHLQWNVDLNFLIQFEDIDKLKFLNHVLTKDRTSVHFDTKLYKQFILKFYHDENFNKIYEDWIKENKNQYALPSLDHIIPLSKGGNWDLDNLQFLPWCVNRAKYSFSPEEWNYIKHKYFND